MIKKINGHVTSHGRISSLILKLGTMSLTNGKSRSFNLRTRYNEKTKHSQICVTGILNLLKKLYLMILMLVVPLYSILFIKNCRR
jgi:ribose/xylose/arabinose/galactoside ABC-type transport system permease subunit